MTITSIYKAEDFSYAVLTFTDEDGYPVIEGSVTYLAGEGRNNSLEYHIESCGRDCQVLVGIEDGDDDDDGIVVEGDGSDRVGEVDQEVHISFGELSEPFESFFLTRRENNSTADSATPRPS